MGQDTPDWGGKYVNGQFYPLDDHAELAVRLGAVQTYDRRGACVWWYDFHYGVGDVGPQVSGAGSAIALNADQWESPPFSCKLQAGTDPTSRAWIERRMALPTSLRVGYQASYRVGANTQIVYNTISHYDGSDRWYSYLYLDFVNNVLKVLDGSAGLVTILDPLPPLIGAAYFAHVKLVADLANHTLVRGILDQNELDLSAYTMAHYADATAEQVQVRSMIETSAGVAAVSIVDNMIITANEP
jgi:hypothetical protein